MELKLTAQQAKEITESKITPVFEESCQTILGCIKVAAESGRDNISIQKNGMPNLVFIKVKKYFECLGYRVVEASGTIMFSW